MAQQPTEDILNSLLEDLKSGDNYRRETAVEKLVKLKANNERVISALEQIAANDPNRWMRQSAKKALKSLQSLPPVEFLPPAPPPPVNEISPALSTPAEPVKQPSEETINKLLEELRSSEAYRRKSAIETIAELKIDNEKIVSALKATAANDANRIVSQEAKEALIVLGVEAPPASESIPSTSSKKPPVTTRQKYIDLAIGFFVWYVVNTFVWFLLLEGGGLSDGQGLAIALNLFILPANLIVLIILAFVRRWVALGILVALAANFVIAAILGLITQAQCGIPFLVK
ncbi:MAG: HEAT repeat domain-containing protein [Chloroflexi bacterium]|nr:HEAT repeat domain-containing protein [Chloroflexota bacterium]